MAISRRGCAGRVYSPPLWSPTSSQQPLPLVRHAQPPDPLTPPPRCNDTPSPETRAPGSVPSQTLLGARKGRERQRERQRERWQHCAAQHAARGTVPSPDQTKHATLCTAELRDATARPGWEWPGVARQAACRACEAVGQAEQRCASPRARSLVVCPLPLPGVMRQGGGRTRRELR
jgi:hypothetical protein